MMKRSLWIGICLCCCLSLAAKSNVSERKILYPSVDQHGDSIILSGCLSVPQDKAPKGIILLPHYTICSNDEAPSNKVTAEAGYFNEDFVLVMPDYLGYGVSGDRVHPYLHGELTARNTVDMLFAVQPILDSMSLGIPLDSIYIVGVSQGGATAVWTLKLIEEEFADKIHVIKCFASSGPYDVAATYDEAKRTNFVGLAATIAILVTGTDAAYDLHLDYNELFTRPMQRAYTRYIADKKMGVFPILLRMPSHKLTHWLKPQALDKTNPQAKRLYEGLLRSSLVHYPEDGGADSVCTTWRPTTPLYILHSTNDDVVTFRCAENLQRCLSDSPNITWDFDKYGNHLVSIYHFYTLVQNMLSEEK